MDKDRSKIDELNQSLYSRTSYRDPSDKRSVVKEVGTPDVEEKWQTPNLDEMLAQGRQSQEVRPFVRKFFTFSVVFFVLGILMVGYVFLGGSNFVSSKNVDINIVGPAIISAGEVLDLGVAIENKNNTDLELANFSIQYPQGSKDSTDTSKTLTYQKESLGVINAGDEIARNVQMILLGSTGEMKEIKFSVEYKVKGSNATFYKDKIYQVTIGNTPLSMVVDGSDTVVSGERFTTTLNVTQNSAEVLKNVILRAEYPYGYSAISSSPEAISGDNAWSLGDLSPGSAKKITIQGKLDGEDKEQRTFRFYVGVSDNDGVNPNFKTVILSTQKTVSIERPSIALSSTFNGESAQTYTAPAEQLITTYIRFQNNLSEKLLNPRIEAKLAGSALNKSSVYVQNDGTYNSSNLRISWNPINSMSLPELSPGESNAVAFSFSSLPKTLLGNDPTITVEVTLTGTPIGANKPISITEVKTVRISSQVSLSARSVYSVGPFANTGPVPPKVDQETLYTAIWSIGNTQGDISNAKVTAKLGPKVKWVSSKSDRAENISYDEKSNTVTWDLEQLVSGTGFSKPGREVAFQVSLTPSATQVGSAPVLVSNISFSGVETVGGGDVSASVPALTTKLPTDPAFIQGDDIVVK